MFLLYLTYCLSVILRIKSIVQTPSPGIRPFVIQSLLTSTLFSALGPLHLSHVDIFARPQTHHSLTLQPFLTLYPHSLISLPPTLQGNCHGVFRSFSTYLLKGEAFRTPPHPFLQTDFCISPQQSVQSHPWTPNKDEAGDGVGVRGLVRFTECESLELCPEALLLAFIAQAPSQDQGAPGLFHEIP